MRSTHLLLAMLVACGSETQPNPGSSPAATTATTETTSASAPPSESAPAETAPPAKDGPAKLTSPIRENFSSAGLEDGGAFEARLFVSKLTPADGVKLIMHFKLEKNGPLRNTTIDIRDLLTSLRFEVTSPAGKTTLQGSERQGLAQGQVGLPWLQVPITLDGSGMSQFGLAWQQPAPGLFASPGKYSVAISGELKTSDRTIAVALTPLEFEIVAASASFKSIAELATDAAKVVQTKKGLASPPQTLAHVIDDTEGNRWFSYQLPLDDPTVHRFGTEIVQVLLDPAGAELNFDAFVHSSCVAAGVAIATPKGKVPVDKLAIGDSVVSYDVASKTKKISLVEHVSASQAERLIRLGDLLVTGAHPIYSNGQFDPAATLSRSSPLLGDDLISKTVTPIELEQPATVYELTVSQPHTYFAGGFLVHNKTISVPLGGPNQPWDGTFYRRAVRQ